MAGFGFTMDMIARIRENEEIRSIRKFRRTKKNYHKVSRKIDIHYHEASSEELKILREHIKKQHTIDNWLMFFRLIFTIIFTISLFFGIYMILNR